MSSIWIGREEVDTEYLDKATATELISSEATARTTADTTLQTNITSEATTRATADTTLQTNITSEATTRATADTTLRTLITNEMTARASAESALTTAVNKRSLIVERTWDCQNSSANCLRIATIYITPETTGGTTVNYPNYSCSFDINTRNFAGHVDLTFTNVNTVTNVAVDKFRYTSFGKTSDYLLYIKENGVTTSGAKQFTLYCYCYAYDYIRVSNFHTPYIDGYQESETANGIVWEWNTNPDYYTWVTVANAGRDIMATNPCGYAYVNLTFSNKTVTAGSYTEFDLEVTNVPEHCSFLLDHFYWDGTVINAKIVTTYYDSTNKKEIVRIDLINLSAGDVSGIGGHVKGYIVAS